MNGVGHRTRLPTRRSGSDSWNTGAGGFRPRTRLDPSRRPSSTQEAGWIRRSSRGEILTTLEGRDGPSLSLPATSAARKDELSPQNEYPLRATAFTPAVVDLMGGQNQPALFELLGQPDGSPWRVWVEISPDTAHALKIEQGTWVRVSSPYGAIEAVAVLADGAALDSVAIAHVPFMPGGGRWARTPAADVRRLWPRGRSALGTVPANVTRV